jgi:STE24 endopeptidase
VAAEESAKPRVELSRTELLSKIGVMQFAIDWNIYAFVVLLALLGQFLIELVSNLLNLKSLSSQPPEAFRDLYDPEKYKQSQEYTRARTRFHLFEAAAGLIVLLAFWLIGGFAWLDQMARNWFFSPIISGLFYFAALGVGSSLLSLPFQIYSTFVIEERFGFNRTSWRTFCLDRIKAMVLTAVLGGVLLAALLWFFERSGTQAWLWAWLATTLFILVAQFVAPVWIMPLFNKFTPLEEGELKERIRRYAESVNFPFRDIYVVDGSKRSSKANAFFTGFGRSRRIALFDTLVSEQTGDELLAVLAHEVGHFKKKHVLYMMAVSIIHTGLLFFLLSLFLNSKGLFAAFGMNQTSVYGGFVIFGLLYEPVSLLLSIAMNAYSRSNEFAADRFSVETGLQPEHLISSLEKLSVKNLSNLTPHPFYVFLHYSHPPLRDRIAALR